jgi:hypothetical protein
LPPVFPEATAQARRLPAPLLGRTGNRNFLGRS